jgi:hypothetical protein
VNWPEIRGPRFGEIRDIHPRTANGTNRSSDELMNFVLGEFFGQTEAADFLLHAFVVGERPARVGDFSSHDREERLSFWQMRRGNLEDVL